MGINVKALICICLYLSLATMATSISSIEKKSLPWSLLIKFLLSFFLQVSRDTTYLCQTCEILIWVKFSVTSSDDLDYLENSWVQIQKQKSMCVIYFLPQHKLCKYCSAVKPSAPRKPTSPLVMRVHYRKTPIIPSLVPPSFTSPWNGINATPLLGFLHDLNASMRTEMISEG